MILLKASKIINARHVAMPRCADLWLRATKLEICDIICEGTHGDHSELPMKVLGRPARRASTPNWPIVGRCASNTAGNCSRSAA
jgi:hypothetical protein